MDYEQNPVYQKMMQRIVAMQPWQRAILSSASVDAAFAGKEMARQVESLRMGAAKSLREAGLQAQADQFQQRLAESGREFAGQHALAQERLNTLLQEDRRASTLGLLGVGVSGLAGYADLQERTKQADTLNRLLRLYQNRGL
jgi:CO/xanthine dehydrogenase Mo-binding subunit